MCVLLPVEKKQGCSGDRADPPWAWGNPRLARRGVSPHRAARVATGADRPMSRPATANPIARPRRVGGPFRLLRHPFL